MSREIDERIVEMRFDNRQFESGVQTSLSTLDKLKKKLDLDGAAQEFDQLSAAAKRCDISILGRSVETVQAKFSAMEIMAITALSNITNSALNTGKQLVKAFTIDPVKTGFQEYETQINAIQTILANTSSKGTTLEQVNSALDELNHYADMTIYNFTEMTRNIGTFTAAGIDLDTSVSAIKGIANLAAVSGSTSQQASTAMYQLSQALAAGTVKLQDWNSVVNAGMGGQVFQDALKDTARVHGIAIDAMIKKQGSFRETLQEGWLTSEVLTETLNKFTGDLTKAQLLEMGYTEEQTTAILKMGETANNAATEVKTFSQLLDTLKEAAQSGWTATWELLVGDFEEAKGTLSEFSRIFSGMIEESAESRNSVLKGSLMSSWGQLKEQVSSAGLSVTDFRDTLQELASESVDGFDKMVEEAGSFDATLSKGWMTTDILAKALDRMANKATGTTNGVAGLSDAQLENIGYTKEQIQALRDLSEQTHSSNGDMEELLANMTRKSGRELIFDAMLNSVKAVQKVFGAIKSAWSEIFPPATSEQLYNVIAALNAFSQRLIISDETADKLNRTFKGLFAILDIGRQAFSAILEAVSPLLGGVSILTDEVLNLTSSFGDWLVEIDNAVKKGNVFSNIFQAIVNVISSVAAKISEFLKAIKETFKIPGFEVFHSLLERVHDRMSQIVKGAESMGTGVSGAIKAMGTALAESKFMNALQTIYDGAKTIGSAIIKVIGELASGIVSKISEINFDGILDLLNGVSLGTIAVAIKKFLDLDLGDVLSFENPLEDLKEMLKGLSSVFDNVRSSLEAWQTNLKAGTLIKLAGAIAVLSASIIALSFVDSDKLSTSLGAITVLFANLLGAMAIFTKVSTGMKGFLKSTSAMMAISISVLVLATALKKISDLDLKQLAVGLTGIAGLMTGLVTSIKVLGSSSGTVVKGAAQMVIFASAIKLLASVCKDLAELEWDGLAKGLTGVGVLLAEVSVFLNTAKFSGKSISTATGIVVLSAAIKILASACKDFGQMNWSEIGKGLTSIGTLLIEVAAFTKLTGNAKHIVSTGLTLIEIAAAMKIFASAISDFSNLEWEQIARGLIGMGVALAEVAIAVNLMPKNMVGIGTGLIAVGAALEIVANVLGKMGGMSWEQIGKGLVTLGGALAELAIGLKLMTGTLGGSAAMIVAVAALGALTPVLMILGSMSWEGVAKGLVSIAGAFTVIGVAGKLLTPLVPSILGLAGAFALIGAGTLGIGAGLLAIGAGLSAIAVGIAALAASMGAGVAVITAGLAAIITGIAAMIPAVAKKIGEAIVAFCQVITDGMPAIGEAVKALVLTLVDVLVECVPALVDGALELLTGVLSALVSYTPEIVESLLTFLIQVINGVADRLPELIQAAVNLLASLFSGIIDALSGLDTAVLVKAIAGVGFLTIMMGALSGVASLVPGAMVGIAGLGAVIAELALVLAAVGIFAQLPGLSWLIGEGGKLLGEIGVAIGSFIGGIAGGFLSGVSSQFPQIGADLSAFMANLAPFIDGAGRISPDMLDGVRALTEVILMLTAAEILNGLTSWLTGGSSLTGFAEQLVPFGNAMSEFSKSVTGMNGELVSKAAIAGKTLAETAAALPNSGGVIGFFVGNNDMESFGVQLEGFGSAMVRFSNTIKGLDADAVTNAAIAGKTMGEMAAVLANGENVMGYFSRTNDMSAFGIQLAGFGEAMKKYSMSVSGMDLGAVTNSATAGQALAELAKTVPKCGGLISFFSGEGTMASFGDELTSFGKSLSTYSTQISNVNTERLSDIISEVWSLVNLAKGVKGIDRNAFSDFSKSLSDLARTSIDDFISVFSDCDEKVSSAVYGMLDSISTSIREYLPALSPIMDEAVNSLVDVIGQKSSDVSQATAGMMTTFGQAILDNQKSVQTAMNTMVTNALDAIKKLKSQFIEAGKNAGQGFINGINTKLGSASTAGRNLGLAALNAAKKALDSHSPSREFIHLGKNIGEGLAIGVNNSIVPTEQAASGMVNKVIAVSKKGIKAFEEWADERKYYGELSLSDELTGWEHLQKKYKAGSESRKKIDREIYRIQNELVAFTYQASIDWIEEEKYYNRMSLEEELAEYEKMQTRYLQGSDERKKIDREIYRLRNELISSSYQASIDWMEEEKFYGRLSTQEELDAYEEMQKEYAEGSEERKKIDREVYTLRNQLVDESYQRSIDWIEEEKYYNRLTLAEELAAYKRGQAQYAKGTEQRKKLDREVYRLEQEIYEAQKQYISDVQSLQTEANEKRLSLEEEYADKVKSVNEKLASDIESLNNQYQSSLESRANSLYRSYGLFDEVKEKEEVSGETLLNNLKDQVQEFGEWQDTLDSLSAKGVDSELIGELQEMGPSAIAQIKALNSMSDSELEKYVSLWSIKHAQAREQAVDELEGLRLETQNNIAQLRAEAEQELNEYRSIWQKKMDQITEDTNAELIQLQKNFSEKVGLIRKNTEQEMQEMSNAAQKILKEAGWDATGQQIVTGLTEGVQSEKPGFLEALTEMALEGVQAVKDTLDINSPSRVFRELGNYTGLGFVKGLSDYASNSYTAGAEVANSATDGLSGAISTISDFVNSEFDMNPTIRPVLDFSDVARGAGEINGLFNTRTFAIAGQTSSAFNSTMDKSGVTVKVDNDNIVQELRSLRSEMADMTNRLERMRIVLDTGVMVGEMAGPMDDALGRRQTYRGRGN